jgi:aminopeptidase N
MKNIEIATAGGWRFRGEFTTPGARAHFPPDLRLEPVHLSISLELDLETKGCQVAVEHTIRGNAVGATGIVLNGVALQGLQVIGGEHKLQWTYDGEEIAITFADGFAMGETRQIRVEYAVHEPVTGLYFMGGSEARPDAPRYVVTDHETERARHWLATVDFPAVRPTLEWKIRTESAFTVVANGRLVDERPHDDGTKTAIWRQEQPCPSYLSCFIAGEFERYDDEPFKGAPISYFAPKPHRPEDLKRSFGRTGEMLAWMTERLGAKLPWPKYYQFAAYGIGGAMENISLVSWDDRFVLDETTHPELGWRVDQINLHEMAHTWFGDIIVCRDYAHAWLKESWATYMEACWLEHDEGRQGMYCDLYGDAEAYFEEADHKYKRPIVAREFNHSWNMYDRHLYPGGACRLHTLREHVGDEAFWHGVRAYVERYSGHVVETEDFRRVMEEHSGRSLVEFFDQWIFSPGYPLIYKGKIDDARY